MNDIQLRRVTSLFLVITPIAFTICFTLLQVQFEYPAILRAPVSEILQKFVAGGTSSVAIWYAIMVTALLFIPLAVLLHQVIARVNAPAYLWIATTFGVLAGILQALGFLRWTFLVPYLAASYVSPETNVARQEATTVIFDVFHRYAGVAIGEHLGYLCTSIWTALVSIAMLRLQQIKGWLAAVGVALSAGIFVGIFEAAGWELGGTINAISYLLWAAWLVALGMVLLLSKNSMARSQRQPATL